MKHNSSGCGVSVLRKVNFNISVQASWKEGDMGICGVAVLVFFYCGDAVNKSQFAVLR